jgi:hypothetical protein
MTKKTFAHTMLWIAAVPLIAFMAWRTIMLVNLSLPGDAWYFGIAAVGAIEMGVFVWAMLYRWYALDNPAQRVICILMMFVSMLGSVTAFFTETFIQASRNGNSAKVDAALITIAIWVVSSVIALNAIGNYRTRTQTTGHAVPHQRRNTRTTITDWNTKRDKYQPPTATN